MTRIVKSIAVVDNTTPKRHMPPETDIISMGVPIIKRQVVHAGMPQQQTQPVRDRDSYIDELNRLRVEIAEAKAELKRERQELNEIRDATQEAQLLLKLEGADADARNKQFQSLQEQARLEAQALLEQAQEEAETLREQARSEGYLEGFSAGTQEARSEYQAQNEPRAQLLERLIEQVSSYEQQYLQEHEREMVDLIVAIAQKIVCREISEDRTTIVDMLRAVVEENRREEFVKITLAEDLMPIGAATTEEVRTLLTGLGANVTVYTDNIMKNGACMVETPKGFTEVSVSTQLNNIAAALKED